MNAIQTHISYLLEKLFEPENRQHRKVINSLIEQNTQILGTYSCCFDFRGETYGSIISGLPVPSLDRTLIPAMVQHMAYRRQVELDYEILTQLLHKLLRPCESSQDIRNALPDCMAALNPGLSSLPRTADEAWTLKDNPRDLRQYQKYLTKIEMYCALKYIY